MSKGKEKIQCHCATKKQELIDFVERNKGEIIELHWEGNMYPRWGDDDFTNYDTSKDEEYNYLLETINTHYIHGIKCV